MSEQEDHAPAKIIVADILPPVRYRAHTVAAPALMKKPSPSSTSSSKKKDAAKRDEALVDWFEKGRASRDASPVAYAEPRNGRRTLFAFAIVGIMALTGIAYGISRAFATVHITIEPKQEERAVQHEIMVSTAVNGEGKRIAGELLTLTNTKEADTPATGSEKVNTKASGVIIIYNAFSSQSQGLVANTRFESSNGKIYRIPSSITIPGATLRDGKLVPSSIEATVYADQPGPGYNSEPTDFTIPGFKGTPKFEGFYARAKTSMAGGAIGQATVVTQSDIDRAAKNMEQSLRDEMRSALTERIPAELILPESAYEVAIENKETSARAGDVANSFHMVLTMRMRVIGFRIDDMSNALTAILALPPEAKLANSKDLSITVAQKNIDNGTMMIRISGNAKFVWRIDEDALKKSLIEEAKTPSDLQKIFSKQSGIEKATARFSPAWVRSIPAKTDAIIVEY